MRKCTMKAALIMLMFSCPRIRSGASRLRGRAVCRIQDPRMEEDLSVHQE